MTTLYPWLEPYQASLAAVLEQGRFPHALLLTGQPATVDMLEKITLQVTATIHGGIDRRPTS